MCGTGDYLVRQMTKDLDGQTANPERRGLIIFVRKPELGKVKTRLAAEIGAEAALAAYIEMLAHTRDVAEAVAAERHLFYFPEVDADDAWPKELFHKHKQAEGDLGQKMQTAFETLFARGLEKVVIIGSDCMDLRPSHVDAAFRALALQDVVLGPAADGGYYLLGLRSVIPAIFQNKTWSTDTVLTDTLADLVVAKKTVHLLGTLRDVDTLADWKAVKG